MKRIIFFLFLFFFLGVSMSYSQTTLQDLVDKILFIEDDILIIDDQKLTDFAIIYRSLYPDVGSETQYLDYWKLFAYRLLFLDFKDVRFMYRSDFNYEGLRYKRNEKIILLLQEQLKKERNVDKFADVFAKALMMTYEEFLMKEIN
jgi:hypothetical protein